MTSESFVRLALTGTEVGPLLMPVVVVLAADIEENYRIYRKVRRVGCKEVTEYTIKGEASSDSGIGCIRLQFVLPINIQKL